MNGYKSYLNITNTPTNSSNNYFDSVNNNVNNINNKINNNYVGSDKFDDVNLPNMFTNFKI